MARTLDVYLHQSLVGYLTQDDDGLMAFTYAERWLDHPEAIALSHSLPLRQQPFNRSECRAFFNGILPEEANRRAIAKNLGISANNDFAMLEEIGGECAGAITFLPMGAPFPESDSRYRPLTQQELADILRSLPRRPLLAGEEGVRLSLAGAQDKIAVFVADGSFFLPLGGAPSTHILKPAVEQFAGLVFNEAFCMRLSRAAGLPTANVELGVVDGVDYLLVERYDRLRTPSSAESISRMTRLHQEDFCQALGITSEHKYQNEGGPSLQQCFALLRDVSSVPVLDLRSLLDGVIFNFLIGNNDAHGKNFSLLYQGASRRDLQVRLAPFYDLLSTVYYPDLAPKMAMKIGGEYVSGKVMPRNFERLAEEAGLGKPFVKKRVHEMAETLASSIPAAEFGNPVAEGVAELVRQRCRRALEQF